MDRPSGPAEEGTGGSLVPVGAGERPPFAEWLRRWRRHKDLSQLRAAQLLGYSRNYWAQLETGRRAPTAEFLERLAAHAGLSGRVLADWALNEGPAPPHPDGPPHPEARPAPAAPAPPAAPLPPYPGYPGYPPYPAPYPPYPAYPAYPEYPRYPDDPPRKARYRPRPPPRRPGIRKESPSC